MSGHSKWAKIKRAKAVNDAKKGKIFTKLSRDITMAAKEGGGDPDMNFTLRLAIDKAKQANMPVDNIERAIKKGTGELEADILTQATYEVVLGSTGLGVLIDVTTDNTNRTYAELNTLVERGGGKLASAGSVSWQFQEVGELQVGIAKLRKSEKYGQDDSYEPATTEEFEEFLIEIEGVLDYEIETDPDDSSRQVAFVTCERDQLAAISKHVVEAKWKLLDSYIAKKADNLLKLDFAMQQKLEKLLEEIDEFEDSDNTWHNAAV